MTYEYIHVYFMNESTAGLNEYYNRDNVDACESVIIPVEKGASFDAELLLDDFLANVCYCDAYHYLHYKACDALLTEKANNIFVNLLELAEFLADDINPHNTTIFNELVYRLNQILD